MIKNIIISFLLILFIILLTFLFFYKKDDIKLCKSIVVDIRVPQGAGQFMRDSDVINELIYKGVKLNNIPLDSVNMFKIENILNDNPLFSNAQVTRSLEKEQLIVVLEQKYPKYMVQMKDNLYYVGENKKLIPVNFKYIVDVPLVTGDIDSLTAIKPYTLIEKIQKDSIFRNIVGQIYFSKYNGFSIVPRIANVPIILGFEDDNWNDKINKVHIFLNKIEPRIGWQKIDSVNLSFKNQIVVSYKKAISVS